jgi:hypothetical protein
VSAGTKAIAGLLGTAVVAGLLLHAGDARADAKKACVAAYEQTQSLRDAGKLSEARKAALACTVPECPGFVVKECTQWLAQIDASMPTVVLEVRDATGAETGAAQVSLDGQPWLGELDGKAKAIDPGAHVLRYVVAGAEPREEKVQIREGEKNRKLVVTFKKEAPAVVPVQAPAGRSAGPWVVGGIGVAALVVGAVLGGITVHDYGVTTDPSQCSPTLKKCTTAGANAEAQGRALGPATTVALVAGGAAVAGAGIWLGVLGREKKPAVGLRLTVGPTVGGAGLGLGGTW